jgi:holo-[acyl-carrier protein] synthase
MIVGLGMDLVEIGRIKRAMENPRFLERILTPTEREFAVTPSQVAGRWAAKEAIYKALGVPLTWQDIEVLPTPQGAPRVTVKSVHVDPGRLRIQLSITHERTHAAAVAIVERLTFQAPMF